MKHYLSRTKLLENIHHIYRLISYNAGLLKQDGGALLNSAGYCLFLFHYHREFKNESANQLLNKILENFFNQEHRYSEKQPSTISYCSGAIGTGWLMLYLKKFNEIEYDEKDDGLDQIAASFFNKSIIIGNYDFLHGASGALYYMLFRTQTKQNKAIVRDMVDKLLQNAVRLNGRLFWEAYDFEHKKVQPGILNLGLSHGTPALLAILSKVYIVYGFVDLREVIQKCAFTILGEKNKIVSSSIFSYSKKPDVNEETHSRLGWCYGDLGVAISLWHAGKALEDPILISEATEIFDHASKRKDMQDAQIKDAALCHGAAGLSHIFYKYYLETNCENLMEAAEYWLDISLEMLQPTEKLITGKTRWHNKFGYLESYSLLEGITGIGLSMLSQLSDEKLTWDDSLLM